MTGMSEQPKQFEATIVWNDWRFLDFFRLRMPYDPEVAYDIQRTVPYTERAWHEKPDKNWVIHKRWFALVEDLLVSNDYVITIEEGDTIKACG